MRVTISDACIFLDLFSLKIINEFFELDLEFHVPSEILNELSAFELETIKGFERQGKIQIHVCQELDWTGIAQKKYPNSIAHNDKIALYLSDRLNTLLLSTDKVVRQIAKQKSIEYHGIFWVFDRLVENGKIEKNQAVSLISSLIKTNRFYQQNAEFADELQKRVKLWQIPFIIGVSASIEN